MRVFTAEGIVQSFGDRRILSDVRLECRTGDVLGIFGRNGCGKSTLLKILFGVQRADQANLRIDGEYLPQDAVIQSGLVSYLPQESFLLPDDTVRSAVKTFCGDRAITEEILSHPLLEKVRDSRIRILSGGELKYLEILLIASLSAPFLLLDEPFSGLSPLYQAEIVKLIQKLSANRGIILSDHQYRSALSAANRVALVKGGSIEHLENPSELRDRGYLPV